MQNLRPLNTNLGGFSFFGSGIVSGGTSFQISNANHSPIQESYFLIFIRELDGSEDVYDSYMYVVYARNHKWSANRLGTPEIPNGGATITIDTSVFTFTWTSTVWARAWIYEINYAPN